METKKETKQYATANGWYLVGYCPVDSGQLMIVDPCYLNQWKDNEYGATSDYAFSYAGACNKTIDHTSGSLEGTAVVTSTTYGDGTYPVYINFENGKATEMRVLMDGNKLSRDGRYIDEYEDEYEEDDF